MTRKGSTDGSPGAVFVPVDVPVRVSPRAVRVPPLLASVASALGWLGSTSGLLVASAGPAQRNTNKPIAPRVDVVFILSSRRGSNQMNHTIPHPVGRVKQLP